MQFNGKPVKASRLFAGYEHDKQTERIALFFEKKPSYYKEVIYNPSIVKILNERGSNMELDFSAKDLSAFSSYEVAYHQLVMDIVRKQIASTDLVLRGTSVSRIFVDGGFTQNQIFMNLIANAYQHIEVYAASIPQASALGAALVLHSSWNSKQIPNDLVQLQFYRNEKNIL